MDPHDPNEALKKARAAVKAWVAADTETDGIIRSRLRFVASRDLVEAFEALDAYHVALAFWPPAGKEGAPEEEWSAPKPPSPHWTDCCNHNRPRDRFLGTVDVNGSPLDVFVYQDNALDERVADMHVCLRYGNKGSDYSSPGNAIVFVRNWKGRADYAAAMPLVEAWVEKQSSE